MKRAVLFVFLAGCNATPAVLEVAAGGLQQPAPVTALAFSPDGTLLLSGDPEGVVRVWDVETGKLLRTFDAIEAPIARIVLSPDGSRLAALSAGDRVTVFPLRDGLAPRTVDAGHTIRTAAFLPDASAIVTAGEGRRVECWDLSTGEARWMVDEGSFPLQQVLVSPDGTTVACRVRGGKVTFRSAADGAPRFSLPGFLAPGTAAAFLPDSRFAVFGAEPTVWDITSKTPGEFRPWVISLLEWPRWVNAGAGIPDIRNGPGGRRLLLLECLEHLGPTTAPLAIRRNGTCVAGGDTSGRLAIHRIGADGRSFSGFAGSATRLAVAPGGRLIAGTGPSTRGIRVWPSDRPGEVTYVGPGARDNRFAFLDERLLRGVAPGKQETSKAELAGTELRITPHDETEFPSSRAVGLSRDGRKVAVLDKDGGVRVLDGEKVLWNRMLPKGSPAVEELHPSLDGSIVIAISRASRLIFRLSATDTVHLSLHASVRTLDWTSVSGDGSQVLFPDGDGRLLQFDLAAGAPVRRLVAPQGRVTAAVILGDGNRVVAGTDRGALLLFAKEDADPQPLSVRHAARILALAVSADDRHLASSSEDDVVLLQHLSP